MTDMQDGTNQDSSYLQICKIVDMQLAPIQYVLNIQEGKYYYVFVLKN